MGTVATAPTPLASRRALEIYRAALDGIETPAVDIAFLRSIYRSNDKNVNQSNSSLIYIFVVFAMLQ
jgi:hypothetical protein